MSWDSIDKWPDKTWLDNVGIYEFTFPDSLQNKTKYSKHFRKEVEAYTCSVVFLNTSCCKGWVIYNTQIWKPQILHLSSILCVRQFRISQQLQTLTDKLGMKPPSYYLIVCNTDLFCFWFFLSLFSLKRI